VYLNAAALGDVPIVRQSLGETTSLNVNCVDYMGRSAPPRLIAHPLLHLIAPPSPYGRCHHSHGSYPVMLNDTAYIRYRGTDQVSRRGPVLELYRSLGHTPPPSSSHGPQRAASGRRQRVDGRPSSCCWTASTSSASRSRCCTLSAWAPLRSSRCSHYTFVFPLCSHMISFVIFYAGRVYTGKRNASVWCLSILLSPVCLPLPCSIYSKLLSRWQH